MPEEKRRSSRIFFDVPAALSVLDTSYTVPQIANLSLGGCLLEIKDNIPVGVECEIKILIDGTPQGMRVDAEGLIVRSDDETVGIEVLRELIPDILFI